MPSPDEARFKCSQESASVKQAEQQLANGEAATVEIYELDIYTRECVKVDTITIPPGSRVNIRDLIAKGSEKVRDVLKKK